MVTQGHIFMLYTKEKTKNNVPNSIGTTPPINPDDLIQGAKVEQL